MAYSKVERHMWNDDKFRRFPRDVRDMWQYLLTTEHSNRLGLFVLDPLYAAADLSAPDDRWTEARVDAAWSALEVAGRVAVDRDARLVLVVNHFKHNQPENPNVVKGAMDELAALPFSEPLFRLFAGAIRSHLRLQTEKGEPFAEPWLQVVEERLRKGSANRFGNGMPNPEPEPEPEPELKHPTSVVEQQPKRTGGVSLMRKEDDPTERWLANPKVRAEFEKRLRAFLWLGDEPPKVLPGHTAEDDWEIFCKLAREHGVEETFGAMQHFRKAISYLDACTMRLFMQRGRRDLINDAIHTWRKSQMANNRNEFERTLGDLFRGVADAA